MENYRKPYKLKQKLLSQSGNISSAFTFDSYQQELDLTIEKQYLSKLKAQRQKTQKLYSDYMELLQQRDLLRQTLQNSQKVMKEHTDRANKQSSEHTRIITELTSEISSLKEQLSEMTKDRKKSLSQLQSFYQVTLQETKHQMEQFKQLDKQKTNRLTNLGLIVEKKNQEVQRLQSRLIDAEKDYQCQLDQRERTIKELTIKIQQTTTHHTQLRRGSQKRELENQKLKDELEFKNEQYESIKKICESAKSDEKQHLKLIKELQQQLYNANRVTEELKNELSHKISELQGDNQRLRSKSIKQSQSLKSHYESKVQPLESAIRQLKLQIKQAQQTINQYRQQNQRLKIETQRAKEPYQKLIEKYKEEMTTKQQDSNQQLEELRMAIERLKDENINLMNYIKQKQHLLKERRDIMSAELKQVDNLQRLLRNVNLQQK